MPLIREEIQNPAGIASFQDIPETRKTPGAAQGPIHGGRQAPSIFPPRSGNVRLGRPTWASLWCRPWATRARGRRSCILKQTASGAVNAGGVAPGRRIVHVKVERPWLGKETPDCMLQRSAINQFPADHHGSPVERAYGQLANAQLLRYLIDGIIGLLAPSDVDCESHAIRGIDRMMLVVDQQELVALV